MDDKHFISSLAKGLQSSALITALVEFRGFYNSLLEIVHDKTYPDPERKEARELTKDGFYEFVNKVNKMNKE